MAMLKLMLPVALLLAINLHSTDGQACSLLTPVASDAVLAPYAMMGAPGTLCSVACPACGMTAIAAGTDDASVTGGRFTNAVMQSLGVNMCPTITYTFAARTAAASNIAAFGIGEPDTVNTAPGMMVSTAGRPLTPASGINGGDSRPLNGYGVMSALSSSGFSGMADGAGGATAIPGDLAA